MSSILRGILAVLAGIIVGIAFNLALVSVGGALLPPPEGVDITDMESIRASLDQFGPQYFIFPLIAHAFGTLVGAAVAALIAPTRKLWFGLGIGLFFLIGGIANIMMVPSPTWFIIVDLIVAYIPMGWLGGRWAEARSS